MIHHPDSIPEAQTVVFCGKTYPATLVHTYAALIGLSFFWLVMVLVTDPYGEFPLNDDWMYARSVFSLVEEGRYTLCDFQAATAFIQILWGALFAKIFGFSMTILRVSVLVLGWAGVLAAYLLFQKVSRNRPLSFVGAALLASTPFYFLLAHTFMTNIPFCAFVIASVYFLLEWIENETRKHLIVGIILICFAALIRQLALFIPLAFAAAYWVKRGISKKTISISSLVLAAVMGTLFLYELWLKQTIGIPHMAETRGELLSLLMDYIREGYLHFIALDFIFRLNAVILYLGIFLFPLLILTFPAYWAQFSTSQKQKRTFVFVIFVLVWAYALFRIGKIMPLLGIYIYDFGFGPKTIQGSEYGYRITPVFWKTVSAFGLVGGGLLMVQIVDALTAFVKDLFRKKDISNHWLAVFCLSACLIHFAPFGFSGHFDHYISIYIPFMILFLLTRVPALNVISRKQWFFSGTLMLLMTFFSVAGTHDYLAWNRARWAGLHYLMQQIPPTEIDGGYEFNGWFLYDPNYQKIPGRSWWWVTDDKYMLSFGPKEGYGLLQLIPYRLWLPPGEGEIAILKRIQEKVVRDYSKATSVYVD